MIPGSDIAADVDVVIVAHDSGPLLEETVQSVRQLADRGRAVVVDAESKDDSIAALVERHPSVRVIQVPNKGFSFGNNVGIAATSGEYVLLLNPDAVLEGASLTALLSRASHELDAAIVAPRVVNEDGSIQWGSYGSFPTLARMLALHLRRVLAKLSGSRLREMADIDRVTDVDWVTGACMLVRRKAIEQAGLMDEGFFLYYEDVEWCHRMHDHGWRVIVEPAATCVHHLGKSGGGVRSSLAYRESFYRYCRLYRLWGLALFTRGAVALRSALGGRS